MNGKDFMIAMSGSMLSALMSALQKAENQSKLQGITVAESLKSQGIQVENIHKDVIEIGDLINQVLEMMPGRDGLDELCESYEGLLEIVERITGDKIESALKTEKKENPLEKLIALANQTCKESFMNYPDYDEDNPITTIEEALTIFVLEGLPENAEVSGEDIYDFISRNK